MRVKFWFWKTVRRAADWVKTYADDVYAYAHDRVCDEFFADRYSKQDPRTWDERGDAPPESW